MGQGKRLVAYLLLNIIVSAGTTLSILWLWNQAHPTPIFPQVQASPTGIASLPTNSPGSINQTSQPIDTVAPPLPLNQVVISIVNIFGVGDLANEYVLIKSTTDQSLVLTKWSLEDNAGDVYVFPELTLNKGGAVQVHTTAGVNTVIDLYWGRDASVWKQGVTAVLRDGQGIERANYTIP